MKKYTKPTKAQLKTRTRLVKKFGPEQLTGAPKKIDPVTGFYFLYYKYGSGYTSIERSGKIHSHY
jgi:hypothetical protein